MFRQGLLEPFDDLGVLAANIGGFSVIGFQIKEFVRLLSRNQFPFAVADTLAAEVEVFMWGRAFV